uniref:very-long-chain (3R)-3-hydroxyacyl-CoA dehydratase n=1 Tax=Meloidogyne enterolobii TaxID=390850 RepID=A0A6V7UKK6_MELEN|nr:unnamed protein product [Meloidogyne enterolobii]
MKPGDLYLLAYNILQFFGWGSILLKTVRGLMSNLTFPELYDSVEMELKIFQTAAILEVLLKIFFKFFGGDIRDSFFRRSILNTPPPI